MANWSEILGMRFINFMAMVQSPQLLIGPQPMQIG
jgi:hypothetical protein